MNDVVIPTLYGLSLFSGIGGLDYGIEHILPQSKTICYVEGEIFNAKILFQKMQKGELSHAPIYSDVRTFPSVAHNFSEKVDSRVNVNPSQNLSNYIKHLQLNTFLQAFISQIFFAHRPETEIA